MTALGPLSQTPTRNDALQHSDVANGQTGFNPHTGIANDFLNQYNEIIMLLEALPDDRDFLDDIRAWQPDCYHGHFRNSGLSDVGRILAAYEAAPFAIRVRFERVLDDLNQMLSHALANLVQAAAGPAVHDRIAAAALALAAEVRISARLLRIIIATNPADAAVTPTADNDTFGEASLKHRAAREEAHQNRNNCTTND